jgi:tetratricopeptide (TPR) repeat protein
VFNIDEVIRRYERAGDLAKAGKTEEAIAEYKAELSTLEKSSSPDRASRIGYFATKLAYLLYNVGRYNEARTYFEMMGQEMPKPPVVAQTLTKAVKAAKKVGLLGELSKQEMEAILDDIGMDAESAEEELGLIEILQSYYASETTALSPRAVKDGFLHHDWRYGQETDDVIAEICQLIGSPIYRQISYTTKAHTDCVGEITTLNLESDSNKPVSFTVDNGLEDIIAFMNVALEKRGDKRRFVSIDTQADWFAYYLLEPAAYKELFIGKYPALPEDNIPGVDGKKWAGI